MEPITWALIGVLAGAAVTAGGFLVGGAEETPPVAPVVVTAPPDPEAEAVEALSDLSLIEPICAPEFIATNGPGLCREMFCWMQSNAKTGETSGIVCEEISNINNTITIQAICVPYPPEDQEECYQFFRERK